MDAADKRLCDLIQNEFPLVPRPYEALGTRLEMSETEVLERVTRLRAERIIRQVSAIFDTRRLGYRSCLVAARVPGDRADAAAMHQHAPRCHAQLRARPRVQHLVHDRRAAQLEARPRPHHRAARRTRRRRVIRPLPALKFFKIGVDLDMKGGRNPAAKKAKREPSLPPPPPEREPSAEIAADPRAAGRPAGRFPSRSRRPPTGRRLTVGGLLDQAAEFQAPARCDGSRRCSTIAPPASS